MIKRTLIVFFTLMIFQSCGFLYYNYRGYIESDFLIPNANADTTIRCEVAKLIYRQSFKSKLYQRLCTKGFDSLHFYGPDYHTLWFKITEKTGATNIHFSYFGYSGWRGNPPHKLFITAVRDSLKNKFGAMEFIRKEISNEKKKKSTIKTGATR